MEQSATLAAPLEHARPVPSGAPDTVDLAIDGMSCAACAGRVETALRRVPGVSDAAVNLATERARVTGRGIAAADLSDAVAAAGYGATPVIPEASPAARDQEKADAARRDLWHV